MRPGPCAAEIAGRTRGPIKSPVSPRRMVRIYTKPKGKHPDFGDPVVLQSHRCTIEDFCNKIHKNMIKSFKYALVWGSSAKYK